MLWEPGWVADYPELAGWLLQLDETQCEHLDDHPQELAVQVQTWLPGAANYGALTQIPDLQPDSGTVARVTLAERDAVDMPGRKRLQAGALCAALLPITAPALDWCCGKGHLARTLARAAGQSVTGFEWNPALVNDGNRLARRFGDPVSLRHQDVMEKNLTWPVGAHGLALHACGDLHRKLIREVIRHRSPRLSLSPCCYHLTDQASYVPLSERARQQAGNLVLSPDTIRLAVQETVTAPVRVRIQTRLAQQWRLGFDGLQRELRGVDSYLPLPPHPGRLMNGDFEGFCRWAAERKSLTLPAQVDWARWEEYGAMRLHRVRRYELLRHLFRRPLELWLALDYALVLEEAGYRVRVGTFCDRALTPRNLLVDAILG